MMRQSRMRYLMIGRDPLLSDTDRYRFQSVFRDKQAVIELWYEISGQCGFKSDESNQSHSQWTPTSGNARNATAHAAGPTCCNHQHHQHHYQHCVFGYDGSNAARAIAANGCCPCNSGGRPSNVNGNYNRTRYDVMETYQEIPAKRMYRKRVSDHGLEQWYRYNLFKSMEAAGMVTNGESSSTAEDKSEDRTVCDVESFSAASCADEAPTMDLGSVTMTTTSTDVVSGSNMAMAHERPFSISSLEDPNSPAVIIQPVEGSLVGESDGNRFLTMDGSQYEHEQQAIMVGLSDFPIMICEMNGMLTGVANDVPTRSSSPTAESPVAMRGGAESVTLEAMTASVIFASVDEEDEDDVCCYDLATGEEDHRAVVANDIVIEDPDEDEIIAASGSSDAPAGDTFDDVENAMNVPIDLSKKVDM